MESANLLVVHGADILYLYVIVRKIVAIVSKFDIDDSTFLFYPDTIATDTLMWIKFKLPNTSKKVSQTDIQQKLIFERLPFIPLVMHYK